MRFECGSISSPVPAPRRVLLSPETQKAHAARLTLPG
jgi:hypothetical protein